jgi:hypothetical protein
LTALEGDSSNGVSLAQTSLLRARALQQMGDLRAALMAAREAHNLFAQKFGDSDVSICNSFFYFISENVFDSLCGCSVSFAVVAQRIHLHA